MERLFHSPALLVTTNAPFNASLFMCSYRIRACISSQCLKHLHCPACITNNASLGMARPSSREHPRYTSTPSLALVADWPWEDSKSTVVLLKLDSMKQLCQNIYYYFFGKALLQFDVPLLHVTLNKVGADGDVICMTHAFKAY